MIGAIQDIQAANDVDVWRHGTRGETSAGIARRIAVPAATQSTIVFVWMGNARVVRARAARWITNDVMRTPWTWS